jgi:hypothetical protein
MEITYFPELIHNWKDGKEDEVEELGVRMGKMKITYSKTKNYVNLSHLSKGCQLRLYPPVWRTVFDRNSKYLLFPHLLFLRTTNNGFRLDSEKKLYKPGCCLFVGATDSEVKKIVHVGLMEVYDFHACLGSKNHFTFPRHTSFKQLIEQFWSTSGNVLFADCLKKCKTPEEVLRLFQHGQLESENHILRKPITLEEFIAYAKRASRDSAKWR